MIFLTDINPVSKIAEKNNLEECVFVNLAHKIQ